MCWWGWDYLGDGLRLVIKGMLPFGWCALGRWESCRRRHCRLEWRICWRVFLGCSVCDSQSGRKLLLHTFREGRSVGGCGGVWLCGWAAHCRGTTRLVNLRMFAETFPNAAVWHECCSFLTALVVWLSCVYASWPLGLLAFWPLGLWASYSFFITKSRRTSIFNIMTLISCLRLWFSYSVLTCLAERRKWSIDFL